jgi:hypothetical protein
VCHPISNEMDINFDVFHVLMKHRVRGKILCTHVITLEFSGFGRWDAQIRRIDWTHITSVVAFAITLYSASVLYLDTFFCFFAHQEMRFGPRKTVKPLVDFLSLEHLAQFASEKTLTRVDKTFLMLRSMPIVC